MGQQSSVLQSCEHPGAVHAEVPEPPLGLCAGPGVPRPLGAQSAALGGGAWMDGVSPLDDEEVEFGGARVVAARSTLLAGRGPAVKKMRRRGAEKPLLKEADRSGTTHPGVEGLLGAAQFGSVDGVKNWLAAGVEVSSADAEGWTALHLAAQHGHMEVCLELLWRGADVEATNGDGRTPMDIAYASHAEMAEQLATVADCHRGL